MPEENRADILAQQLVGAYKGFESLNYILSNKTDEKGYHTDDTVRAVRDSINNIYSTLGIAAANRPQPPQGKTEEDVIRELLETNVSEVDNRTNFQALLDNMLDVFTEAFSAFDIKDAPDAAIVASKNVHTIRGKHARTQQKSQGVPAHLQSLERGLQNEEMGGSVTEAFTSKTFYAAGLGEQLERVLAALQTHNASPIAQMQTRPPDPSRGG